jgi:hypothetical protein
VADNYFFLLFCIFLLIQQTDSFSWSNRRKGRLC